MKKFDIMEACEASAKDFCDTLLACLENDKIFTKEDDSLDEDLRNEYKEYLDSVLEMHYNTDIGEQGENIEKYLDECNYYEKEDLDEKLTLLQEEEHKIGKWLKENGYTTDENCVGAGFETIDGHQGRAMDFEGNKNIEDLDVDKLADIIDDRLSVRVSTFDEDYCEEYKNLFCVEIWLNN